ncbi:MFS transporter [Chitinophagaceae bacterium LWZ2-11]
MNETVSVKHTFTKYQAFIITILAILQFTVVLDFMVLSPLGAILMESLKIDTSKFGLVVSGYAFSAGAAGLLTAGFADKFDRKKLLLFFYAGFIAGTIFCGTVNSYNWLLIARIVTGLFGGVISSISFAIITDLFKMEVRGRVMGFVQMAFAVSQVAGIPVGLLLANKFGWHSPFIMIASFGIIVGVLIIIYMKPITEHLKYKSDKSPFAHLLKTVSNPVYLRAFLATTLLATGGFMLMPFGSAFSIHNLGITMEKLPIVYAITGVFSMIFGPLMGKVSDKIGKYPTFLFGSILSMIMVVIYTNLGVTPLWAVILISVIMFVGIMSRMISSSALMTAVPEPQDRGAFMSINSSVQQISGGIAAAVAGLIVIQSPAGKLLHYDVLGYVVIGSMIASAVMLYFINRYVMSKTATGKVQAPPAVEVLMEG